MLDVLFVIGLGMGLPGAGVATVISQWVLAMLMIWKMIRLDVRYNLQITRLFGGLEELPGDHKYRIAIRNAGSLYEYFLTSDSR